MRQKTAFVRPKHGLLVRMPITMERLPDAGATVPLVGRKGNYWRRRLRDDSIEIVEEKSQVEKPADEEEEKPKRRGRPPKKDLEEMNNGD